MRVAIIVLLVFLVACGGRVTESRSFVDRDVNLGPEVRKDAPDALWSTVSAGRFEGERTYGVQGQASVVENNGLHILTFTNFWIDQGPDLKVYLSKDGTLQGAVDLGVLQQTVGEQSYGVPGFVNPREYRYVLVHSRQFGHSFATATLS